ncbi:GAP family protein [Nocardioides mangrovi]|uniref:GAP family protein n=1 Tax=Nocardioides mangrovi TaxID=2874580 RepID=A0ABS7UCS0_9ACTN|nr:GAP family protein [Nocardioides mangrovi]MBZ5738463.1 GAP family protein [Nocardioides mangrovi]
MGSVLGQLLPLAVGVAISPVPVIATILMLLGPRARAASAGFLLGWVAGILLATVVVVAIASSAGLDDDGDDPSAAAGWIKIALGALLLLMAVRQWRGRPRPGQEATLPRWMAAIDTLTLTKGAGLGLLLSAANPKNLLLCVAAGTAIGGAGTDTGEVVVAVAFFTVLAASTVAVPVVGYLVAHDRLAGPLDELKVWLEQHNAAVMSVLLLILGAVLVGKGLRVL